jgi:hypothetical protein
MSETNSGRFSPSNLPNARIDLAGIRYGRLIVLDYSNTTKGVAYWRCRCDCGKETLVRGAYLRTGNTTSCGCWQKEFRLVNRRKYPPETKGRLRSIWHAMLSRCEQPTHKHYPYYGGRGIAVYEEWRNDYLAFWQWAVSNGYDNNLELDRRDNNQGYTPDNCRWATRKQQNRNSRHNVSVTAFGERKLLIEWTEDPRCVVVYGILRKRISNGWNPERALTLSSKKRRKSI